MQLRATSRNSSCLLTCVSVRQASVMRGAPVAGSVLMPMGKDSCGTLHTATTLTAPSTQCRECVF